MRTRKLLVATAATIAAVSTCALFSQSASAQSYAGPGPTPVFTDDLDNGSSVNTATGPGGTPTASYTSYNMNYDKGVGESYGIVGPGDLQMTAASSSSMFGEAQAVFSSSAVTLGTPGDYIDFILEFTDTTGLGNSGGSANELNIGLYDDAGSEPLAGNNATMTGETGGTQAWSGYYSQILAANGGTSSKLWYRPSQISNTGSGNQTLTVNTGSVSGGYGIAGAMGVQLVNGSKASTLIMTNTDQYTEDFRITLLSGGVLSVSNEVFTGLGTGGALDYAFGGTTNATDFSFDGLCFAFAQKDSAVITQDVSLVQVSDFIQPIPEPSTWLLLVSGLAVMAGLVSRRRIS